MLNPMEAMEIVKANLRNGEPLDPVACAATDDPLLQGFALERRNRETLDRIVGANPRYRAILTNIRHDLPGLMFAMQDVNSTIDNIDSRIARHEQILAGGMVRNPERYHREIDAMRYARAHQANHLNNLLARRREIERDVRTILDKAEADEFLDALMPGKEEAAR